MTLEKKICLLRVALQPTRALVWPGCKKHQKHRFPESARQDWARIAVVGRWLSVEIKARGADFRYFVEAHSHHATLFYNQLDFGGKLFRLFFLEKCRCSWHICEYLPAGERQAKANQN